MVFIRLTNLRLIYRICPYMVSASLTYLYTSYLDRKNNVAKSKLNLPDSR